MAKMSWVPLSLLGATLYGSFSFMLSFVDPKIKKSESAQFGYGTLLVIISGILGTIIHSVWRVYDKQAAAILDKHISWWVIAVTLIFSIMISPMHALVINQGGSVGQQMMYSLAIIPVLIGSRYFFGEQLSAKQWAGLAFAGVGAFLMSSKTTETME